MNNALFSLRSQPYEQISVILIISSAIVEISENKILSQEQRQKREELLRNCWHGAALSLAHYIQRRASAPETVQILEYFRKIAPHTAAGFQQGYLQPRKES